MNLKPRLSRDGRLAKTENGWQLAIPAGAAKHYRLSQLDDQIGLPRAKYAWRPPLTLSLRSRVSTRSAPGTWGFGFWNDPYGFSLGPGDTFLRLPTLPQAAWFFHASPSSYLSFRDDKAANGFIAQAFRGERIRVPLILAGMALPVAPRTARRVLSNFIDEDSVALDVDSSEWHAYRLEWVASSTKFWVDDRPVLESAVSPSAPLGLVIWIDNQYAAFDPQGRLRWGTEQNPSEVWLAIEDLSLGA